MNTYDLIKDFKKWWLNQGHSSNSASSYVSYIRKAIKIFLYYKPVIDNGLDSFFTNQELVIRSSKDENKITRDIQILFRIALKESGNALGAKKTYKNALSGLITFFNYMYLNKYQYKYDKNYSDKIKNALVVSNSSNIVFKYSNKEIFDNFNARINTQDRVYEHIILNFCTINNVLKLDKKVYKEYSKIKKEKLFSTKFIIEQQNKNNIPLSSVKELIIKPLSKCVIVDNNNIEYKVFTECDPFDRTIYELLYPIDINQLSIDHDNALNKLIGLKYQDYPNIVKLSDMIARYFNYTSNDYKKIKPEIDNIKKSDVLNIIKKERLDSSFSILLFQDLRRLYNQMGYSIMYGPYNSKKSG